MEGEGSLHADQDDERFPQRTLLLPEWLMGLRYKLSRTALRVSIPLCDAKLDVTWADVLFTIPIAEALILAVALPASHGDVQGSAIPAAIGLAVALVFAIHAHSVLIEIIGIPFARAIFNQQFFTFVSVLLGSMHGLAHLISSESYNDQGKVVSGIATLLAVVAVSVLSTSALSLHRFGLYVQLQWLSFAAVTISAIVHGAGFSASGLVPMMIDVLLSRYLPVKNNTGQHQPVAQATSGSMKDDLTIPSVGEDDATVDVIDIAPRKQLLVCCLPGQITRIQFPRLSPDTVDPFEYRAGQWVLVCIPDLSNNEWHPFSISSSPDEDTVTIHVKAQGNWTRNLLQLVSSLAPFGHSSLLDVIVDGPYGSISLDIYSGRTYSDFVLLAGGIGVTFMRSIANWLHYECYDRQMESVKRVHFAWAVRDFEMIKAIVSRNMGGEGTNHAQNVFPGDKAESECPATQRKFAFEFCVTDGHHDMDVAGVDPQLLDCIRVGSRPDTTAIIRKAGVQAKLRGDSCVAVLVCGPPSMLDDAVTASHKLSMEMNIQFDVHNECFSF